jgi:hypothetical protein
LIWINEAPDSPLHCNDHARNQLTPRARRSAASRHRTERLRCVRPRGVSSGEGGEDIPSTQNGADGSWQTVIWEPIGQHFSLLYKR